MRVLLTIFIINCIWCNIACHAAPGGGAYKPITTYYPDEILCAPSHNYVKCARLPSRVYNGQHSADEYVHITAGTVIDDTNWTHFRNGAPITGYATNVRVTAVTSTLYRTHADCVVTEPFVAILSVTTGTSTSAYSGAQACTAATHTEGLESTPLEAGIVSIKAYDGDTCPDGFYTVPYESWCGEGMVNIADVPNCADDTSGEYCLISIEKPCESGISAIKTSTELSFALYAEKYTQPAIAVKYNDTVCWAKLEPGRASSSINIKYNDAIYHVIN